jgi:UDP-glucose:(heptosyl)LPS alpha-1,3-glucosyltransferase
MACRPGAIDTFPPVKFALVLEHFDPARGGLERYAADWASWLIERGHEVHVVARDGVAGVTEGIVLHRAGGTEPDALGRAQRLAAAAAALEPDVLHDLGGGLGGDLFQPLGGARKAGRAAELRALDVMRRWRRRLSPAWQLAQSELDALEGRRLRRPKSLVVACSQRVADDLVVLAGAPRASIRLLYNAVDSRRYVPTPPAERAARRRDLGWPPTGTLFLQIAHNFRLKGVAPALKAVARLLGQGFDLHLAVAGRGPNLADYRALAGQLGIVDRVRFLGAVEDTRTFFAAADALVHPAFYDACSLSCLEAWASGLPVALSRADGASGLMTDGVQGWLIDDPGDPAEIAFRMKLLLDPGQREAMGAQARVLAQHNDAAAAFLRLEALGREAAGK